MLKKSQVLAAGLIVILLSAAISYAVSASVPTALLAAGTTRYAVASSTGITSTDSVPWVNMTGMSTNITIPAGHTADLIVMFCGEFHSVGQTAVVRATVGSLVFSPREQWVYAYDADIPAASTGCALFSRTGVGAGAKTVRVQWRSSGSSSQESWNRSMVVIANIH